MTTEHDGGPASMPSPLDFLPQSLRTQLTMERLALMREITSQAEGRERLEKAIREALKMASNRWAEWGERALAVADILEAAIGDVRPEEKPS